MSSAALTCVALDLFGPVPPPPARARRLDPDTSREAARSVDPAHLEELVRRAGRRRTPSGATATVWQSRDDS